MGGVGFHLTLGQHIMKQFLVILPALLGLAAADKSGGHVAAATNQVPLSSQGAAVPPYYSEYDYAYEPQTQSFSSLDRQASIEAVLGAPVVTAFAAALFGGILSPLISEGLSRMGDYQIEWPPSAREWRRGGKPRKDQAT